MKIKLFLLSIQLAIVICYPGKKPHASCVEAFLCLHGKHNMPTCGRASNSEVRRFLNPCDLKEFNCEYATVIVIVWCVLAWAHGPPKERDNEDISMGRKMGGKWCGMAKTCNHDRVPVCGVSHAGDVMGFRDLCDMFDFNCIRRRNYKQTTCPQDKSILTVSRRPTSTYYED